MEKNLHKMRLDLGWLQRRFWDFRQGHGIYLAFALSFFSFIVINYNLLGLFQRIFPNQLYFALTFLLVYPPLATLIGYRFHRKRQLPTDQEIATLANPFLWKAMPGKELMLNLPIMRDTILLRMDIARGLNVLTPELESAFQKHLKLIETLMQGKTLGA